MVKKTIPVGKPRKHPNRLKVGIRIIEPVPVHSEDNRKDHDIQKYQKPVDDDRDIYPTELRRKHEQGKGYPDPSEI